MASTAARSLSLIAVAHGNKFKDVYCVFVSPTQPFRFGERMAGGEPSDRLKLEYWLKAASFVSFDGGDQYRTPNRSFIFLLTCGAALHRHCAKAVVQLLDSAGVESTFQLAECPPIDGKMLFRTDVRERLFRHAMSDQSAVGLAVRHVTAAPIDGEDSTSQLLSLGFDPGRPENDRLFAVARAQSGKSVRSWAYDHLMHVFLARGILHVPLIGDATKMQRSVDTDEIVGARKVAVRKRDSWTLLGRRYIANQPRLAQLVIDVPALLGDIGVEDNWIVLCHGTTIAAASLILSSSCNVGSPLSDFGSAFYTTEQIQYALQCAYFKADCGDTNNRDHDPAVIIFAFPRDKLDELPPYFVRDHAWQHLVTARHRGEMNKLPPNERARAYAADVTVGAVSANAGFIASTEQREVARPMVGITQHAFHERATNILDVVGIEYGRVAVLRVLVNAHEWGVATDTD
jgi:hypothetical protein